MHEILWNKHYVCRSPIEEAPVSMEVILEEHVELPQGETEPGMSDITTADLLRFEEALSSWTCLCACMIRFFSVVLSVIRLIIGYIKRFEKVSFHSLLPPEAERSTTAHLFYKILGKTWERLVFALYCLSVCMWHVICLFYRGARCSEVKCVSEWTVWSHHHYHEPLNTHTMCKHACSQERWSC